MTVHVEGSFFNKFTSLKLDVEYKFISRFTSGFPQFTSLHNRGLPQVFHNSESDPETQIPQKLNESTKIINQEFGNSLLSIPQKLERLKNFYH
jgi:hypothetical protein